MDNKEQMYLDVFEGKSSYIPLLVKVKKKGLNLNSSWECFKEPRNIIENFYSIESDSLKVESDWIPCITPLYMEALVPSFFGGLVEEANGGAIELRQFIDDIYTTESIKVADITEGLMSKAISDLKYLKNNVSSDIHINSLHSFAPLDFAVQFIGGNFYGDLLAEPELAVAFMDKIANVTINSIKAFKDVLDEPYNKTVTVRGVNFLGVRISGDAIVNLSPDIIRESYFPILKKFSDEFGSVMLHYCTGGAMEIESAGFAPVGHVINTLIECPYVKCVDNWHGWRSTFNEQGKGLLQDKIGICTDLSPEVVDQVEKLIEEEPFFSEVPRKGGRAITATVTVNSPDEGKRLYDKWVNYFVRKGMK